MRWEHISGSFTRALADSRAAHADLYTTLRKIGRYRIRNLYVAPHRGRIVTRYRGAIVTDKLFYLSIDPARFSFDYRCVSHCTVRIMM